MSKINLIKLFYVALYFLVRQKIIKIQDQEDFNKHVLNSKEPVVIDFFATYVYAIFIFLNNHTLILYFNKF